MEKNSEYEGIVEGLGTEGEGIVKIEGTTAFVPYCLVGEKVKFKALKVKGNIAYGKLISVENAAYSRTNPPCPVFYKCGGCDLQHMDYSAQLAFKRETVLSALKKIGGIDTNVNETVPCESRFRYRNKLALPIGVNEKGETVLGFYAPHSHRIVPIDDCLIQAEWIKNVISAVKNYVKTQHICGYNEETGKGVLRRIVVREIKGKFIFALVAAKMADVGALVEELGLHFKDFTFLLNINSSQGNAIFGKEWHICRGDGYFEAEECGIKYRAGANTFVQVNDDVREKLYAAALSVADAEDSVIDLYSGGGLLTAMFSKKCKRAYGIEIVPEASRCADELKEANGLSGKMFNICGAVEERVKEVIEATANSKRLIVCDPPRKGMERSAVRAVKEAGAEKIVLISCNPATLARDLGLILGTLKEVDGALVKCDNPVSDYEIVSVTPFDMFPQTKWCETLCVLSHKKPDSHIEVKIDMDNTTLDTAAISERAEKRKPKDKPTYKKMQAWIEENYGFKVHTGYIAEVKRNEGLPMYDSPNAVEELKHPRPHPTPQMVEAIKAALKHFEII